MFKTKTSWSKTKTKTKIFIFCPRGASRVETKTLVSRTTSLRQTVWATSGSKNLRALDQPWGGGRTWISPPWSPWSCHAEFGRYMVKWCGRVNGSQKLASRCRLDWDGNWEGHIDDQYTPKTGCWPVAGFTVLENVCNNSKKRKKSCFLDFEKNVKKR